MKIVVNKCYGGFSISPKCMDKYYGFKGIKCYHFYEDYSKGYSYDNELYLPLEENENILGQVAFDVPNPNDFNTKELWDNHFLTSRPEDRTDLLLIQAIEEIGEKESSGSFAELEIIEIPDGINWEIDEYDGIETIHEKHRSW